LTFLDQWMSPVLSYHLNSVDNNTYRNVTVGSLFFEVIFSLHPVKEATMPNKSSMNLINEWTLTLLQLHFSRKDYCYMNHDKTKQALIPGCFLPPFWSHTELLHLYRTSNIPLGCRGNRPELRLTKYVWIHLLFIVNDVQDQYRTILNS
jgi:hypothetical protein